MGALLWSYLGWRRFPRELRIREPIDFGAAESVPSHGRCGTPLHLYPTQARLEQILDVRSISA